MAAGTLRFIQILEFKQPKLSIFFPEFADTG